MEWKETTFEEDYNDAVVAIEATSLYGRLPCKEKKYMTAAEMGKLLGLKKTDRYWLLHKNCFEWEEIMGEFRVNIPSFEKWYANQVKYKKITGEEPGLELKEWSYSPQEIADLLGVTDGTVYDLIKRNHIETVSVDYWKRVPKEAFYKWYNSQKRYRTKEDRERDAAIENATITMPEMARLLGVSRSTVYSILSNSEYKDVLETVIVADRKKITRESFERFLESQNKYKLDKINDYEEISADVYSHIIDDDRRRNAEMFEDAFYGKQDLNTGCVAECVHEEVAKRIPNVCFIPQLRKGESGENIMTVPEGVDAELLAKVLANPEMTAFLTSLAKTIK